MKRIFQMKKLVILIAALSVGVYAKAQSLTDGIKMYKYERYQSAQKILQPMSMTNQQANYYYGLCVLANGDAESAKTIFAKYAEDIANQSGLARVAFAKGDVATGNQLATAIANKAKKKDWENYKYAADAITYSEGGDYMQAIAWYKKAIEIKDDAEIRIGLGDAFEKVPGGGGDAMNSYEHVTDKDAKNTYAWTEIGELWYAAKTYDKALVAFRKATEADPANPVPYRDLANAYSWSGNYDSAKKYADKYLELSDKSMKDRVQHAIIDHLAHHCPEAINEINKLISEGAKDANLYGALAYCQMEAGDGLNAMINVRAYFAKQDTKRLKPLDYLYYGRIMMMNGLTDSANYYFNKSITIDTTIGRTDISRQIADTFKRVKDYRHSAEWYGKLVAINPETQPIDYFWWTVMLYYAKDYDNAKTAGKAFEAKYPNEASAVYWEGRIYAAVDSEAKGGDAVPYYTKWLADTTGKKKPNDQMQAYQYLLLYYYQKEDNKGMDEYMDKIKAIDPSNGLLKQIADLRKQTKAAVKPTGNRPPAKPHH